VLLGVPYAGQLPGPFFQSVVGLLQASHRKTLDLDVVTVPNAAIHQARDALLKHFLKGGRDFLVMVDSDQVFVPANVERLVRWQRPYVAAMIVHRVGPPKPVAFVWERETDGLHYYTALTEEVYAYLSQFKPERFSGTGGVGVLPLEPDQLPTMGDVPEEVQAGLDTPLLACDGVGTGMVCLSRECARAIEPGPGGAYFDWQSGGEDLSFCRRLLASPGEGYHGFHADWRGAGVRPGVLMDRGCLVGHLTQYSRGAGDLINYLRDVAAGAELPPAAELAALLEAKGVPS